MAQPTTEHHTSPPQQPLTPNVARQGTQPDTEENRLRQGRQPAVAALERPEPVLFDDIDPVLLVRLYPEEIQTAAARGKAMEAGMAARALGDTIIAAQQEPVVVLGEVIPEGGPRRPGDAPLPGQPPHQPPATPTPPHQAQHADKRG